MSKELKVILKEKMKERKISVPKLSETVDIPKDRIYAWYRDNSNPKASDADKLTKWINGETYNDAREREVVKPSTETGLELILKVMLTNFADLKNGQVDIMNQHKFGRAELRAFVMMSSMKDARNDPKRLEGIMETYDKLLSETLTANERTDKDHIDGR